MKNKFTSLLLAAFMLIASGHVNAQTDVTGTYLKNPSFEDNINNWNNEGMVTQNNTSFSKKDGSIYLERWVGQGSKVGNAQVSQAIQGLPNGVYTLKVAAQNIQQNSSTTQTGACIFADDAETTVNKTADYSLDFTVIEGQVTIGFRAENATGNWISCDNFRLYAVSNDLESLHKELQARIDKATALSSEKMQKSIHTELLAATQAATQELNATTDENLTTVATRLRKATTDAKESVEAYADLQSSIDEATTLYGDGTGNGSTEFNTVIEEAKNLMNNEESTPETLAQAIETLEKAMLSFRIANASGTVPTVTTDKRYARGSTMAFGRSTVIGTEISERGFCWSTEPNPTVLDNRTTAYIDHNGYIYKITGLTPSTEYYMRAYAMTKNYAVGYGDVIKVITLPKGTITWWYNNGGPADANTRINAAAASAVDYWNNLTSIQGVHLSISYGAQTPTADCSYGGSMRVGPNASYQRTGTILHEMGHAIGVGTTGIWWNGNMRSNGDRGDWMGPRANEVLRFWDNNPSAVMTGDNTHMWPYGINGANEDNGTEALYIINGLITQGLGEDGLNHPGRSFATPAYVLEHDDNQKYYIKNESSEHGLHTSYLGSDLKWTEKTYADVIADDNMAWYISFNPKTCYYQFRNAETGRYITYLNTGRFTTKAVETPTGNESMQLMRGRVNVKVGETTTVAFHSYWITYPSGSATPNCLNAGRGGRTGVAEYDMTNAAETQRWIFLSETELSVFETSAKQTLKTDLDALIAQIKALKETPHTEIAAGVDNTLLETIENIEKRAAVEDISTAELSTLKEEVLTAGMTFLADATPTNVNNPFDITFLMADPTITDANGWSVTPTINNSCGEFYQKSFDFNQTINGLPAGTYQFMGQAFQRPGTSAQVNTDYSNGTDKVNAEIYAGNDSKKINNIMADAQSRKIHTNDATVGSKYIPTNMAGAATYFQRDFYDNGIVTALTADDSKLKVGLRSTSMPADYWCIFDNFRLYFYGNMTTDEVITNIQPTVSDKATEDLFATPADIYSLSGVCIRKQATSLESLPRGIYIVKGQTLIVK